MIADQSTGETGLSNAARLTAKHLIMAGTEMMALRNQLNELDRKVAALGPVEKAHEPTAREIRRDTLEEVFRLLIGERQVDAARLVADLINADQ